MIFQDTLCEIQNPPLTTALSMKMSAVVDGYHPDKIPYFTSSR